MAINPNDALDIATKWKDYFTQLEKVILTATSLSAERDRMEAEAAQAEEDRDEARAELVRLEQTLKDKRAEVEQAVERQSARIAEEEGRVKAPLQKLKDDLRSWRAKIQNEREQTTRQINDLEATKKQLEATIKKIEGNIRARQNEDKGLQDEMERTRDAFTQEKRNMEAERRSLGDTDQIKEELRLARAAANREKEEIAREVRDMKVAKLQVEKDLKTANANLSDRKREETKAAKAWTEARDRYSQEKHEMEADLENLRNQKVDLQRKNARLDKGKNGEART